MAVSEVLRTEVFAHRPVAAVSGSQFAQRTLELPANEREAAALAQVRQGNIPDFQRHLQPVGLGGGAEGEMPSIVAWVTPDYLALGSDEDFLRLPLGLPLAATIALEFGFVLPTTRIVDAVHAQAALHLAPQPMTPGPGMASMDFFRRHQVLIETQRQGRGRGKLTSGHKKDLVLTARLRQRPGRVAIYGWHQLDGTPIQPLSTVHGAGYADYSHGLRLVHEVVRVAGQPRSIFEVLHDPVLAPRLSDEGVIGDARELLATSSTMPTDGAAASVAPPWPS